MGIKGISIGQMRSVVVFRSNTPTVNATASRDAVTTGGQNDVYADFLTTRGRLRKDSGNRHLEQGMIDSEDHYNLICRFQPGLEMFLKVNGKVVVDGRNYTIDNWERVDQISHIYKFKLNITIGS